MNVSKSFQSLRPPTRNSLMMSCSTVRWRPERSLFALALPDSELLKFGRSTSKFSISVSSRQKVLDVFLSESSSRAQIFDNHLTARRLIVYDFTRILSLDARAPTRGSSSRQTDRLGRLVLDVVLVDVVDFRETHRLVRDRQTRDRKERDGSDTLPRSWIV